MDQYKRVNQTEAEREAAQREHAERAAAAVEREVRRYRLGQHPYKLSESDYEEEILFELDRMNQRGGY